MSVEVVVRQKGLFKKTMPLEVIISDRLLYGEFDGVRLIPDKLGENEFIALDPDHFGRGFSVVWNKEEKQSVSFHLPMPSTPEELRAFYDAVARAATYWHADVELDGNVMSVSAFLAGYDNMVAFNARALEDMVRQLVDGRQTEWSLHAAMWPLTMGRREAERFLQDPDAFGRWLHEKQTVGAYYAVPTFYKTNDGIIGHYMLPCDIPTIFPLSPYVPFGVTDPQTGRELICNQFYVSFEEADMAGNFASIPYERFLERLDRTKISGYDTRHFLLESLSAEEIRALKG